MRMNQKITLLLVATGFTLGGCELMQPQGEDPVLVKLEALERRMQALERVVQNQSLANLTQDVAAAQRQGDELQGRLETLEYNTNTTADRQRQLYVDLDARIQQLEASVKAGSLADSSATVPGQLPMPSGSDRDNYQAAFELLKEQQYDAAADGFRQFLVSFPDSELADNAQYWFAESHYVTQKFKKALKEFEIVLAKYPGSRKTPDALLKIGYCNYELKQWEASRTALKRVQVEFPETTAARLAGQRLKRMEEEGV
jgi:tol-pal system protein YbgF